jgi:dimethylamine/trimethylamine dehydrogenase
VHEHDALASIEPVHNGKWAANLYSREVPLFPTHMPAFDANYPLQARAMIKANIRAYRRWRLDAVKRAKKPDSTSSAVTPGTTCRWPVCSC